MVEGAGVEDRYLDDATRDAHATSATGAEECPRKCPDSAPQDPDLKLIMRTWPRLDERTRGRLRGIVEVWTTRT